MMYEVSKELASFSGIKTNQLSREDVQCIISVYIYLNPEETREKMLKWKHLNTVGRDLRDSTNKRKIIPDAKLSKLLKDDKYKQDVKNGNITMIPKKGTTEKRIVTDDSLYYYVIMKLIQPHFVKKL